MPKPMLNNQNKSQEGAISPEFSDLLGKTENDDQLDTTIKQKLDRILRRPRSRQYLDAVKRLDAGGHVCNQNEVNDIISGIRNEFPEIELSSVLIGIVSKCYLGAPYEVHTLTLDKTIIEHYKRGQPLPAGMERARSLAQNSNYAFIEVYIDGCRAVSDNGTVSFIP